MVQYEKMKYVVFTRCAEGEKGPATYFYNFEHGRCVAVVHGAEAFVDIEPRVMGSERDAICMFLSSEQLVNGTNWSPTEADGKKVGKQSYLWAMPINFNDIEETE